MMYSPEEFTARLRAFADPLYPEFAAWPDSITSAARAWADAVDAATADIYPPVEGMRRVNAKLLLLKQLTLSFEAGTGATAIPVALQMYAATLAIGMAPLYVGTPPLIPLNLTPLIAKQLIKASAEECLSTMGLLVMNWLRTGSAINANSGQATSWL